MKYGKVIPHIYKGEEYLFRYNYTSKTLENVYKPEPEECEELEREAAADIELHGEVSEAVADDLDSYKETGYIGGKYGWFLTEEEFKEDPSYYMNCLSEDIKNDSEAAEWFGY